MIVRAGGTGFVVVNFLKLIDTFKNRCDENQFVIKYLLPSYKFTAYNDNTCDVFNLHKLYDMSLKYIYQTYNKEYFHIIKMQPIDYIYDVIKPTVKIRFISKKEKQVYFRFDNDNDVNMRNINCDHIFERRVINNLILVDYDKGYLNRSTINSLYDYISNNDIQFKHVFLNTKPTNIENYKDLLKLFKKIGALVHIQLNEFEYEPIKDLLDSVEYNNWETIIVTRGIKPILLRRCGYKDTEININTTIVKNAYTTSGCGDMFLANIIYATLYLDQKMTDAIRFATTNITQMIIDLNEDLFK